MPPIVDEVGLLGNAQMRRVLRLAETTGMAVSLVGDPAQCRSPGEGGDPIELISAAIPGAIPELTRSVRQKTAHAIAATAAFRDDPAKGLAMKIADGSAVLVPGGETAMQVRVAVPAPLDSPVKSLSIVSTTWLGTIRVIAATSDMERRQASARTSCPTWFTLDNEERFLRSGAAHRRRRGRTALGAAPVGKKRIGLNRAPRLPMGFV